MINSWEICEHQLTVRTSRSWSASSWSIRGRGPAGTAEDSSLDTGKPRLNVVVIENLHGHTYFIIICIFIAFFDPKQGNYLFILFSPLAIRNKKVCRTVNRFLMYMNVLYIFVARSNRYRTINIFFSLIYNVIFIHLAITTI